MLLYDAMRYTKLRFATLCNDTAQPFSPRGVGADEIELIRMLGLGPSSLESMPVRKRVTVVSLLLQCSQTLDGAMRLE